MILPLNENGGDGENATEKHTSLHNVVFGRTPIVVRREDGFEKRTLVRCRRCELVVAYNLSSGDDDEQVGGGGSAREERDVVYILPGALVSTEDMKVGKMPVPAVWEQKTA